MGRKLGALPPLLGRGAGSPSSNVAWTKAHLYAKCHLDPSSRFATTDMGRKLGSGLRPLFVEEELGSHPTQCCLGRGLPPYQVAS